MKMSKLYIIYLYFHIFPLVFIEVGHGGQPGLQLRRKRSVVKKMSSLIHRLVSIF